MARHSILLIITGSIAAIKTPDLIQKLRAKQIEVRVIMTRAAEEFVSRSEIEKLSGHPVSSDLFAPSEKKDMWHIRFSRETDAIVVAPASADIIAKMAHGIADDMASATLLANNKRLLVAPAMNTQMWIHPATQRNVAQVEQDGAIIIEPRVGMLACGEVGAGRMAEPEDIVREVEQLIAGSALLKGTRALVTSGPTHEAIDPVRYIANRSSGKQGHAIARALASYGAEVTLITGPTALSDPQNVTVKHITSADEMLKACDKSLPVDVAVFAAAVADWKTKPAKQKIKKNGKVPSLSLMENTDILKHIASHKKRPRLVIGFAAETENLLKNASAKRKSKGADWIVANDVSNGKGFDADDNEIALVTPKGEERWKRMAKADIAEKLALRIADYFKGKAA